MTQKERTDRKKRAQALVDLVVKVEDGYRIQSSRDPNVSYFVSKPNGRAICTCSDFEKHLCRRLSKPDYKPLPIHLVEVKALRYPKQALMALKWPFDFWILFCSPS